MKRFLIMLTFVLFAVQMFAVVSRPQPSAFSQPDGYLLESQLRGDEYFHFRETIDNYTLLPNAAGFLTYAQRDARGELVASSVVAHNPSDRTADEKKFLLTISQNLSFGSGLKTKVQALKRQRSPLNKHKVTMRSGVPQTGASKFLVILVSFSDNDFSAAATQSRYNNQFNAANFTTDGATGSVKKYFEDNSLGKFSPQFDVYGPVKLTKAMAYYGANDSLGSDLHPDEMVFDACKALDSQINFANYDANGDGAVDNVYVIYAGYGEASGASANTIWPHQWEVSNPTRLDGKTIGSYSCSNELDGTSGSNIDGVGTACHEFSHATGLPDFYDTDYEANGQSVDTDTWDVMASGCYNNGGKTPPYYTSIEREMLGWGTPVELTSAANVTVNTVDKNEFYKISTKTPNEYFLIENRQQTGWDTGLYSHGMLIYHVDKTSAYASRWIDNTVNADSAHQCVDLVEADGTAYDGSSQSEWLNSLAGDPFPGLKNVKSFTDATTPSMKSWANVASGKPITEITETNGVITFKFMGGASAFGAFSALPATGVLSNGFIANWSAASGATKYLLNVYKLVADNAVQTTTDNNGFNLFPTLPVGWTGNATATYSTNGNFGVASPSVKLDATGRYIQTPLYSGAITSVSFWYKGNSTDASSSLSIEGSTDGSSWAAIETMSSLSTTASTKILTIDPSLNYKTIRITYAKSAGNLAFDDASIIYGQGGVTRVDVLKDIEVFAGNSYNVTGLEDGLVYFYTVKAANATQTSIESNEVKVSLLTGIDEPKTMFAVRADRGSVNVTSLTSGIVRIFDPMGRVICSQAIKAGTTHITLPANQMYIVRIGDYSAKVVVR